VDSYKLIIYGADVHTYDQQRAVPEHAKAVREEGASPGLWASILAVLLFGTLSWLLLGSEMGLATTENSGGEKPELAQVDDQEIAAALNSMGGSRSFQAQFKQDQAGCPRPLAWVSLTRAKPGPPMTIRLRSGNYISPTFNLADVPIRVAIPYPAPYEVGHGTLSVMVAGGDAIVSLLPAWQVAAGTGMTPHEVTWPSRARYRR